MTKQQLLDRLNEKIGNSVKRIIGCCPIVLSDCTQAIKKKQVKNNLCCGGWNVDKLVYELWNEKPYLEDQETETLKFLDQIL